MKYRSLAAVVAVLAVLAGSAVVARKQLRWKKFAEVEPGVLYRSGMLKPWQLKQLIRDRGIKTVFSLTFTENAAEESICNANGVRREFHYLSGDGVGPDDPYLKFLEVASRPENQPILVHCSAGVQRTGGAVALFRVVQQAWPIEKALDEMNAMGNDGNAPQREQIRRLAERLTSGGTIANGATAGERR